MKSGCRKKFPAAVGRKLKMLSLFSKEGILGLLISIPGLLLALSMHEFAHGYVAYLMGDSTAKYSGRLSLNPLHHLDPVGAICMLLFRFGWAKPVPINPQNFRNHRKGIVLVSLAGPFANFILGFISCIIYYALVCFAPMENLFVYFISQVFLYSVYMNVGFMIFNLVPIPPLDGSKILMEFLPPRIKYQIYRYERYFGIILIIAVYAGAITPVLGIFRGWVLSLFDFVCQAIFGMFI